MTEERKFIWIPEVIETQEIDLSILREKGIRLSLRRLDLVHPLVSGNKFFKLKYNIAEAKKQGKSTLLTFGGAFSNHIHAVAAAGKILGIKTIGVIRGEETFPLNPTLRFATDAGMLLHYIDRESFRNKTQEDFLEDLKKQFGDFFLIPEGGTNALAIRGTKEILQAEDGHFSHIAVAVGTGGTFAGLAASLRSNQSLLGFSSLKGDFIHLEINRLLELNQIQAQGEIKISDQYHFGGYAKHKPELLDFLLEFHEQTGVPLDPVYTGKMMFGLLDQVKKNAYAQGSHILAMHTGGLQGILGFNKRFGTNLPYTSLDK
jgi:1-aminocyclopropane-1-carboxylate deaminase